MIVNACYISLFDSLSTVDNRPSHYAEIVSVTSPSGSLMQNSRDEMWHIGTEIRAVIDNGAAANMPPEAGKDRSVSNM
jgi:hypothetical protein